MDAELVAYFDRRFDELREEFRTDLAASAAETRHELRQEIASSAAGLRHELRQEIASSAAGLRHELRQDIAASATETRRHFDVVAESLLSKIQIVAEGVVVIDEKLERFRTEVSDEFRRVDRRLLHIEARFLS